VAHVAGEEQFLVEDLPGRLFESFFSFRPAKRASVENNIIGAESLNDVIRAATIICEIIPFIDELLDGIFVQKFLKVLKPVAVFLSVCRLALLFIAFSFSLIRHVACLNCYGAFSYNRFNFSIAAPDGHVMSAYTYFSTRKQQPNWEFVNLQCGSFWRGALYQGF
jgi:hypothetical protein